MYKKCLYCGYFTDADENRCSNCGLNPLSEEIFLAQELISLVRNGEISPEKIWTKRPEAIYKALRAPS